MGSSRLPSKVMRPILGVPMIRYTLERLQECKSVDTVVLATSDLPADDPLAEYVTAEGFHCFRGSEDDVLARYVAANQEYGGDVVIRVTGDCPLIAPELVDYMVAQYDALGQDYVKLDILESAPRGFDAEVFSREALERVSRIVNALADYKNYKEHVTIYMYTHPEEFSFRIVSAPEPYHRHYRLCVDEMPDFQVVTAVYEHFQRANPTGLEIIQFLDEHPEIASLNEEIEQKKS